jgi:hypothetical protein
MGNINGFRVVLLLTPPLFFLFPVGVLTFVLERISRALLLEQTRRDWRNDNSASITLYGPTSTGSNNLTNTDITIRTNQAPTLAIIGICCLSFVVSIIGVCGIWEMRRVEGTPNHQRAWTWAMFISNVVMLGASTGVLGYATSVQSSERGWQRYEDVGKDGQVFTRETWVCQIKKLYPAESWAEAKATRLLLISLIIASATVLVSLWMLVHERGGLKWLIGGKGRYGGFESAYEMHPIGPSVPYAFQRAPQWSPQPSQQWSPASGQQWVLQSHQQAPQQPYLQASQQSVGHRNDQTPDVKVGEQAVFR